MSKKNPENQDKITDNKPENSYKAFFVYRYVSYTQSRDLSIEWK